MTRSLARHARIAALAATVLAGAGLTASQTAPAIRIASPGEGAYVSGSTRLVAVFDPPSAGRNVERLTFFANGIQVCTLTRAPFECEWDAGDRIVEHQIRVTATMRNGERLVQSVRTKGTEFAETVDVDVVQVTAVVTDGDGRFVKGLRREDFTILEDNKPQEITHFASENIPLEMVTALDVSSSMERALPRVKQSAKKFLAGLRPEDQVTILAFNDSIFTIARRSTDQSYRERVIDRMAPWGGTALHDVIIKAADLLGRQSGRRSIVLFSDGDDQSSLAPLSAAIERTEGSDATIYAIGQGRAVNNRQLQDLMRRLAAVSGGRAFFEEEEGKLDTIFEEILEDLRNQYLLSYPTPSSQRDGKWHDIKVQVAGGKHRVRARQGYRLTKK
jgi:VWFA-related protein